MEVNYSSIPARYNVFVVVNFDALAQASDFRIERKLCWMQDSNPEGLWNWISSRLNTRWQTDWAIEDQAKNLNSTACPYDQRAFKSPLDPTAVWHSHLDLAIYIHTTTWDVITRPYWYITTYNCGTYTRLCTYFNGGLSTCVKQVFNR